MAQRIQRRRTKGWRMPEGAIYVGRPTRWGNPFSADGSWITWAAVALGFRADSAGRRAAALALYVSWMKGVGVSRGPRAESDGGGALGLADGRTVSMDAHCRSLAGGIAALWEAPALPERPMLDELRGHDLACWCKIGDPCHTDVLLELANG